MDIEKLENECLEESIIQSLAFFSSDNKQGVLLIGETALERQAFI